ncbi:MAG: polysaccharide deacetylase family protein [Candidatus Pacebacteria bacterium]|nr:polysaccharide deacetylase family protein [Candidatus Paceibacterota bacterium]
MSYTRRAALVVLGALLVPVFYTFAAFGPNIVQNGNLETASSNASIPQGWGTDKWGTITVTFSYPVAGNTSAKAAKVQVTKRSSGDAKWYFNHMPVTPGEVYLFSDDYSSNKASSVSVEYKLQDGSYSYVWLGNPATTNDTWKTFSKQFTVPANAVSMSVLHSLSSVGTLTIDNVSVQKDGVVTPPTDTCPNVPGDQTTTPCADTTCVNQGGTWNGSSCDMPPPPPTDTCPNVPGNQTTTPCADTTCTQQGGTWNGSSCDMPPPPPTDTCPNVPGNQTTTPCADTTCVNQGGTWNGSSCDMPPPPTTTNLITNGNLDTVGTSGVPQAWIKGSWGTITPVFTYPVTGKSGNAAKLQVTAYTSGDAKWIHNHVTVEAGKTYTYSDDYISDKVTNVTAEFKLSNGSTSYVWLGNAPASASWATFTKQFTVPTGAVSVSILHILNSVGTLTLDNATLKKDDGTTPPPTDTCPNVPGDQTTTPCADTTCVNQGGTWNGTSCTMPSGGSNLIPNGTFETGTTVPQGWHSSKWGSNTATFTYPATGKSGRGVTAQISNYSTGDIKWVYTSLPVSSNTIYEYRNDYNSTAISEVNIEFKLSDGTYSYQWLATAPSTGGTWQSIRAEVTVPRNAVEMNVFHALARNGSLTIDNVSLIALPANPFAQGMVTLVFDDGLATQYQNARGILNTAGIKGMFGIITSEVNSSPYMSWANITTLKNEGHEIGGHSRTHPDLTSLTQAQMQTEIKGSFDDLVAQSFTPKTFIYPIGGVNPTVEQVTKDAGYVGARGSYWGLNSPTANKYALYDIRLDKTTTLASAKAWIDQAIADKRWVIFELHDVVASGGNEYAITTALFQNIVTYIKQSGIKAVTLQEGLQYMAQ